MCPYDVRNTTIHDDLETGPPLCPHPATAKSLKREFIPNPDVFGGEARRRCEGGGARCTSMHSICGICFPFSVLRVMHRVGKILTRSMPLTSMISVWWLTMMLQLVAVARCNLMLFGSSQAHPQIISFGSLIWRRIFFPSFAA